MADASAEQRERLEALVRADSGAAEYPALAELYRRAGRVEEAERVIRSGLERKSQTREGQLILGLVLLKQGRYDDALAAFESAAADIVAAADAASRDRDASGPSDVEIDEALDRAEPDAEMLVTPDRVAEEAVEWVEARADDASAESPLSDDLDTGGAFLTRTMAELLERQGDRKGAARIRAALEASESAPRAKPAAETQDQAWRQHTIAVLERWLQNLRGEAR